MKFFHNETLHWYQAYEFEVVRPHSLKLLNSGNFMILVGVDVAGSPVIIKIDSHTGEGMKFAISPSTFRFNDIDVNPSED